MMEVAGGRGGDKGMRGRRTLMSRWRRAANGEEKGKRKKRGGHGFLLPLNSSSLRSSCEFVEFSF